MRRGILSCPGCSLWRPWSSRKQRPAIDRECIKCGRRIRVQLDRDPQGKRSHMHSQGRGRPSAVQVREFPRHMPQRILHKICREHNRFERRPGRRQWIFQGGQEDTFTRASQLDPSVRARDVDQDEWESIEEIVQREVGESENEM